MESTTTNRKEANMTNPIPTIVDEAIDAFIPVHDREAIVGSTGDVEGVVRVNRNDANGPDVATVTFTVTTADDVPSSVATVWMFIDRNTGNSRFKTDTDIGVGHPTMIRLGAQRVARNAAEQLMMLIDDNTSGAGQVRHALEQA